MSSAPSGRDAHWLGEAIELSKSCPPSHTAFSVGAIIVAADDSVISSGYSREQDPHDHAEEAALAKVTPGDLRLTAATIYSSLEPCGERASRPRTCAELIIAAGLRRVVFAWREASLFVDPQGIDRLRSADIDVIELNEFAERARSVNSQLFND